ncbi:MAG TPA: tail fiber domain-containing protein, partial [Candidatus Paceibacterota bacterium]
IAFIPFAASGSGLVACSAPTNNWSPTGYFYPHSITQINSALAAFQSAGFSPTFRGILWSQGETDGIAIDGGTAGCTESGSDYQSALQTLISNYRSIFGSSLPFYIFRTGTIGWGGSHPYTYPDYGFAQVRAAQDQVAAADMYTYDVFLNALDFQTRAGYIQSDLTHYTQAGYNEMGEVGAENIVALSHNSFQNSSTTTPSIYFTQGNVGIGTTTPVANLSVQNIYGSTNTLLFTVASSTSLLGTTSVPFLTVTTSGNVGIGTNSPYAPLSVWGAGSGTGTLSEWTNSASTTVARFLNNGTAYFVGNVGIGTTTPQGALDIQTSGSGSAYFRSSNQYNVVTLDNLSNNSSLQNILRFNNNGTAKWSVGNDAANGNAFTFSSASILTSGAQVVITTTGSVGLGTTNPAGTLDIANGNFTGTPALLLGGDVSGRTRTGNTRKLGAITQYPYTNTASPLLLVAGDAASTYSSVNIGGGFAGYGAATRISFFTGSATTTTLGTEVMRIDSSGNVAIGTTTPYAKLSVWGSDSASSTVAFNVVNQASSTVFAVFDGGNAQLSGTLTQSSDQRLKKDITSLDASSSLAAIRSLNPVMYNWIDPEKMGTIQYGFIAQDMQKIFPNLVSVSPATPLTPDGTLGINYIGILAPLVKAVQALAQQMSDMAENFVSAHITVTTLDVDTANIANANIQNAVVQKLCVGGICITQDELKALLDREGITSSAAAATATSGGASSSSNGATTTEADSTGSATSTDATASSTPITNDTATSTTDSSTASTATSSSSQ